MKPEELFPKQFLPLTRANAVFLANNDVQSIAYPFVPDELAKTSPEYMAQFAKMNLRMNWELRKMVFVFGCQPKFICGILVKMCPDLDTKTTTFRDLRVKGLDDLKRYKHQILYDGFYVSFQPTILIIVCLLTCV